MNRQDKIFFWDNVKLIILGLMMIIAPLLGIYLITNKTGRPFLDTCLAVAVTSSIGGIFGMGIFLFWDSLTSAVHIIRKYNFVIAIPKGEKDDDNK